MKQTHGQAGRHAAGSSRMQGERETGATDNAGKPHETDESKESENIMSIGDSDKAEIRQSLHAINNALHVLGLQAELARLQLDNGNLHDARAALEQVLRERNNCGNVTRTLQALVHSI